MALGVSASAVAFGCVLFATKGGVGLVGDASIYLSTAQSLRDGHGLHDLFGVPLTHWPPGLPVVLAAGESTGLAGETVARYLNALADALTVFLTFALLRRHVRTSFLVMLGTALATFSVVLLSRAEQVLTESVFIVLTLCFVLALEKCLIPPGRVRWLVAAAVAVWIAYLFRYVGISLIAAGAVAIALRWASMSLRVRLLRSLSFVVLAAIVPVVWGVRNVVVQGRPFGNTPGGSETIGSPIDKLTLVVGQWILPGTSHVIVHRAAAVALVALVAALVVLPQSDDNEKPGKESASLAPLVSATLAYLIGVTGYSLFRYVESLDDRILSPLYVPLTVLAIVALDRAADLRWWLRPRRTTRISATAYASMVKVPVALVLVAFLAAHAGRFVARVHDHAVHGVPYYPGRPPLIHGSTQLTSLVAGLPTDVLLYSNNPKEVWKATKREPILAPPVRSAIDKTGAAEQLAAFLNAIRRRNVYFVWVSDKFDPYLRPRQLGRIARLTVRFRATNADLYRIALARG